ncbi:MAG: hypothetical protein ACE5FA_00310 [Dehalococcoidia bacterium]
MGANVNFKHGLMPKHSPNGDSPPGNRYPLKQAISGASTAYTTKIYRGQPVKMGTSGWVIAVAATNTTNILGHAGEYYAGTSVGVDARSTDIFVHDAKEQEFVAQIDNTVAITDTSTLIHKNFALTSVDNGNTNNGISAAVLDYSSGATTDKPYRVIGVIAHAGATRLSANAKVKCVVNHAWMWREQTTAIA